GDWLFNIYFTNQLLGRRISVAQRYLKTDEIFAGLIVIGLIGLGIDLLFRLLLRASCKWAMTNDK
ncbi:hypothetical protein CI592_23085, partial [Fischerella thermalis CCMEE 5328]